MDFIVICFLLHFPQTIQMSENTFIMTLDGDVDFQPDSVKLLLDRMKKNKKVGAVCGRIHPIGSGMFNPKTHTHMRMLKEGGYWR